MFHAPLGFVGIIITQDFPFVNRNLSKNDIFFSSFNIFDRKEAIAMHHRNRKIKQMLKIIVTVTMPLWGFCFLLLARDCYALWVMPYLPPCIFRTLTGLLCPSCGMTHSVFALCGGDVIGAVRYHAFIPLALILGLMGYVELLCIVLGKPKKMIPRSPVFWFTVLGIFLLYAVLRNLI